MRTIDVSGSLHPFGGHSFEYLIHNMDEAADTKYYGFLSHIGGWIIMQLVTSTGVILYCKGKDNYVTSWTGRAGLTYNYINLL